jgi:hypothetical protein
VFPWQESKGSSLLHASSTAALLSTAAQSQPPPRMVRVSRTPPRAFVLRASTNGRQVPEGSLATPQTEMRREDGCEWAVSARNTLKFNVDLPSYGTGHVQPTCTPAPRSSRGAPARPADAWSPRRRPFKIQDDVNLRRREPPPSLPYKVDTSRPSLRTNWTHLVASRFKTT